MKPDWDRLIGDFEGSKSSGIYDVDCTASGESLCTEVGVKGYPTIKYGDPSDKSALKDYQGGRDYESLKKFADENLGPSCGPKTMEYCEGDEKTLIEGFIAKDKETLQAELKKLEKDISSKTKAYDKKKRKFNTKAQELKSENDEYLAEKEMYVKEKEKFEKKGDKVTAQEKKKQAEKEKKMNKRYEQIEKKKTKESEDKAALDVDKKAIAELEKTSGIKHLKVVVTMKGRGEL